MSSVSSASPSESSHRFPRLSRPAPLMRSSYHTVVIGSGYGGGVAASRIARAGKPVCILELGKEKWPGEYPNTILEAAPELHTSGNIGTASGKIFDGEFNDKTGLYHIIFGVGQNVFVANGLGGTSLLNANVFLEADERTRKLKQWPEEVRGMKKNEWERWYGRAKAVLEPEPMPESIQVKKAALMERQGKALGLGEQFFRVPQTTAWEDRVNSTGIQLKASTLAGQDCTGVNDGSKNSVLMNFLPDAWNWGAEIFCECEVRYIKPHPSGRGYLVFYTWHSSSDRFGLKRLLGTEIKSVHAEELCFLAAGSLGTTEILLRSREHGLPISEKVGSGMSGNGDILAFGYKTDYDANAIGRETRHPSSDPVGPTITSAIDMRHTAKDVLDGFILEEGAIPEALAPFLEAMLLVTPGKLIDPEEELPLIERLRLFLKRTHTRIVGPEKIGPYVPGSNIHRTQIYLVMSHDSNAATLTLHGGKPYLRFEGVSREKHVTEVHKFLAKATHAVGGDLIFSPFYAWGQEQITVHPIGGANYSSDGTGRQGGTNHLGEVFKGSGKEVHNGLVCVDGSVIPCALGVNPFATITALAERSVALVAKKHGLKIDLETKNGLLDPLRGKPRVVFPPS
ncbi:FAD/NAD(P)-binding domain-containing protein [Ascodesmis nigricans]|uniref:FAD/NAD(P)-binding domain-containing protein n=1 Tax=Ascodesmis nigricans TaxID=341454 RepID=A0A4S2N3W5_9PEZI|nr:FAD/NAD(P)-binding domain-containing protein [Ascodesmis nigricans]